MNSRFAVATVVSLALASSVSARGAETIVVSPQGDDAGSGSADAPYGSLAQALNRIKPGGTILLRGGTYPASKVSVTVSGTAEAPITIRAWPNEMPLLDGKAADFRRGWQFEGVFSLHKASHVVVEGLSVCNGSYGITLHECAHVTVRNCRIFNIRARAISASGDHLCFEENRIWNAVLENEDSAISRVRAGGWAGAVQTWQRDDHRPTTNVIFRRNDVRESWGEGIDALFCDGVLIEGNTVRDCYGALIYCDTSRNVRIEGNHLCFANERFCKITPRGDQWPAIGILISMEPFDFPTPPITAENYLIANNLVIGGWVGIGYFHYANKNTRTSYRNVTVCYNVIKDTKGTALEFATVPAPNNIPTGCAAHNNIIFRGKTGGALSLGNAAAWTLSHNCWPNGVPPAAAEPNSFAADPQFLSAAGGGPEGFKLSPMSPCIGNALPIAGVTTDFWGTRRHDAKPTIGIHEWTPPRSEATRSSGAKLFIPTTQSLRWIPAGAGETT